MQSPFSHFVAVSLSDDDAAALARQLGIEDTGVFYQQLLCWIAVLPRTLAPRFGDAARSHLVLEALGIGHLIHRGLEDDAPPVLRQFALLMGNRYAAYQEAGYKEVNATRINIYFEDMWRWWHAHYTAIFAPLEDMRKAFTKQPSQLEDAMRIPQSGGPSCIDLRVPGKEQQLPVPALGSWQATAPGLGNFPVDVSDPAQPLFMEHAVLSFRGMTVLSKFELCNVQGQEMAGAGDLGNPRGLSARLEGVKVYNPERTIDHMKLGARAVAKQLCAQDKWQMSWRPDCATSATHPSRAQLQQQQQTQSAASQTWLTAWRTVASIQAWCTAPWHMPPSQPTAPPTQQQLTPGGAGRPSVVSWWANLALPSPALLRACGGQRHCGRRRKPA